MSTSRRKALREGESWMMKFRRFFGFTRNRRRTPFQIYMRRLNTTKTYP